MPTTIRFRRDGVAMHMHPVRGSAHPEGRWHQPWERHPNDSGAHSREDAEHPYVLSGRYPVEWDRRQFYLSDLQEETYFRALHGGRPAEYLRPSQRARITRSAVLDDTVLGIAFDQRRFGVEIECIMDINAFTASVTAKGIQVAQRGYTHENSMVQWKLVGDGSLRYTGSRRGFQTIELVSPILQGDAGFRALQLVCESLTETNALVNASCGLHVHHDASRDMELASAKLLANNYNNAQKAIDKLLSPSRRSGRDATYCHPFTAADMRDINQADSLSRINTGTRYKALNFAAYARHKTFEFRQHQGSVEFHKIAAWVKFGQAMIQAARAGTLVHTTNDLGTLFDAINLPQELRTFFMARAEVLAGVS